jgi:hypothetical protein
VTTASETDMTALTSLRPVHSALALVATTTALFAAPTEARPDDITPPVSAARHGDHPAVVVQRLQRSAGYDYASQIYPHPARGTLLAAPPSDDQPGDDDTAVQADASR